MGLGYTDNSIDGDLYVSRLALYVKQNETNLANGLLFFSKKKSKSRAKPLRLNFTLHHLYYITERIESLALGVDVGLLNIRLENPNHEPTFVSFMANNAKTLRNFESDTRSISSINSMRLMVLTASMYWRGLSMTHDPKAILKDIRYLYSSFTKIPCLIVSPQTKIHSISEYEEYPCDTAVPLLMFKNLQVLEVCDYDPNELFGWDVLSEQLRILTVRNSRMDDLAQLVFTLVKEDANGRTPPGQRRAQDDFYMHRANPGVTRSNSGARSTLKLGVGRSNSGTGAGKVGSGTGPSNTLLQPKLRARATTVAAITTACAPACPPASAPAPTSTSTSAYAPASDPTHPLPDSKWELLKQLSVTETSIKSIEPYVFRPLANLVKINLSNNLLESIPAGLDQLTNLRYLNLANNFITSLANIPHNMVHLATLNLNNNQITSLDGLELMPALDTVDLRRNKLREVAALKPLFVHFHQHPAHTFENVCLMSNPLPKGYRIEVFNLLNGIRWKNAVKIDDSRPGYFESALLLDADASSSKAVHMLGIEPRSNRSSLLQVLQAPTAAASLDALRDELHKILHLMLHDRPLDRSHDHRQPSDGLHRRTYDLLQSVAQAVTQSPPPASLTLTSVALPATLTHPDVASIASASTYQMPPSPLSPNLNVANQLSSDYIATKHHLSMATRSLPSDSIRKSSAPTQCDADANSSAPSISVVSPVQVTARMST